MGVIVKHLSILALMLFVLMACQQEADSSSVSHSPIKPAAASAAESDIPLKVASSKPLVTVDDKFEEVDEKRECSKPTVIEFYAYHCPHCYSLQAASIAWKEKNKDKVDFLSIPSDLGAQQFGIVIVLHHVAKSLGISEAVKQALFERINVQKKLFGSEQEAADFLVANGADKDKVKDAMHDQKVLEASIQKDWELLKDYKVTSVPRILVNYKYMTNPKMAGGHEQTFQVVDELLKKPSNCNK